jgi:methionyl-tRNA formyltransferase
MTESQNLPTIVVLGDDHVGQEIVSWLAKLETGKYQIKYATRGDRESSVKPISGVEYIGGLSRTESEKLAAKFSDSNNFLISCYWPWILPDNSYEKYSGNTINFHPALLPKDRGWYPHVHQIRHNLKSGVTLHQISPETDGGDIWVQEEVDLGFPIASGHAREILQNAMAKAFKENWEKIRDKKVTPKPQVGEGSYWEKSATEELNTFELTQTQTGEEFLRMLACRNSGSRSFISIETPQGKKYIHIDFSDTGIRE